MNFDAQETLIKLPLRFLFAKNAFLNLAKKEKRSENSRAWEIIAS